MVDIKWIIQVLLGLSIIFCCDNGFFTPECKMCYSFQKYFFMYMKTKIVFRGIYFRYSPISHKSIPLGSLLDLRSCRIHTGIRSYQVLSQYTLCIYSNRKYISPSWTWERKDWVPTCPTTPRPAPSPDTWVFSTAYAYEFQPKSQIALVGIHSVLYRFWVPERFSFDLTWRWWLCLILQVVVRKNQWDIYKAFKWVPRIWISAQKY